MHTSTDHAIINEMSYKKCGLNVMFKSNFTFHSNRDYTWQLKWIDLCNYEAINTETINILVSHRIKKMHNTSIIKYNSAEQRHFKLFVQTAEEIQRITDSDNYEGDLSTSMREYVDGIELMYMS